MLFGAGRYTTRMPKLTIVYGLIEFINGAWAVYVPDAESATGRGATREAALEEAEKKLRRWLAKEQRAGRTPRIRTSTQLGWDEAVKVGLQLGMELVAIPL